MVTAAPRAPHTASSSPSFPPPPPAPCPLLQAWDHVIGHNLESMQRTGYAAMAVAGGLSLIAMFTEFDEE
jgi:hypothetical protein